ncbi:hypothetical protein H5410_056495 [Solanum commersonii]|uniref:Uncharacterized protein n=1 Tax=Solanum commersonii TaxID=4109 RepID=A0A9J5WKD7_SOLCO|nr:hypothetical protein H5410_056495 [Solanum commersonii]
MGKPAHFEGQKTLEADFRRLFCQKISWTFIKALAMEPVGLNRFSTSILPKIFTDVCPDLSYGDSWSKWENQPILIDKLSLEWKFFEDVCQDLSYGVGCSRRANRSIFKVKQTPQQIFDVIIAEIFDGFHQDLSYGAGMESVAFDGKAHQFSRSTVPQSGFTTLFLPNFFVDTLKTIAMLPVGPDAKTSLLSRLDKTRSGETPHFVNFRVLYSMDILVIQIFDIIFAEIFHEHLSRPELYSQLVPMGKQANFQGLTVPEVGKPPFCQFLCDIVHGTFGDLDLRCHFIQKYSWTIMKTLALELVCPDWKIDPFSRSNVPRTGKPPILPIFMCFFIHESFADLDFDVIFAKKIHGCQSRP